MVNVNTAPKLPNPDDSRFGDIDQHLPAEFQDVYMKISAELDPNGELDPDYALLNECANYAYRMRSLYKGDAEMPVNFLPQLYERELRYVIHGMNGIHDLLRMNQEAGNEIKFVNVLWDLDRSQVAVADTYSGEMHHIPRPGWGHLIRKMDETVKPAHLRAGVVSDRPYAFDPSQTVNTSGHGLKDYAYRIFREAGIADYLDSGLIISSTDSQEAISMQPHLQEAMRKKIEYDVLPKVAQLQVESGQFDAIDAILDHSKIGDKKLEYHPKVGVIAYKAVHAEPGEVFVLVDDLESVRLIHSQRAVGIYIPPKLQPYLPDEGLMPEMLV